MTAPFQNIVQHLFHQPSLQDVPVEELQKMAEQHPSFATARFLLLKKMQDTDHPGFTAQLHKTTLYFNNPLWLQFLLQPPRKKDPPPVPGNTLATTEAVMEPVEENKDHIAVNDIEVDHIEDNHTGGDHTDTPAEVEVVKEETTTEPQPAEITGEQTPVPDIVIPPLAEEKPLLKEIIETPASKDDMLFEPFYTIDYFASQGIKFDKLDANPQDKFGKQLKSFTEWLRSMKKLPQAAIEKTLAENEESEVVTAAAHSLTGKDIITEAMAEVLEKQGLHEKATEVYHKLSLLNPAKSAYFAAKIEALKQ